MDRIKRLSFEVLEKHKSKFGENFTENKKSLDEVAIVRSKGLKNEIAGYITNFIKKENREKEFNLSKTDPFNDEGSLPEEQTKVTPDPSKKSEENVIEVGVETPEGQETNETSEENVIEVGVETPEVQETNKTSEEKIE